MNRRILRLAIPNIISNITIPLLGMADTAIAGRLGSEEAIGAVAVASTIFGFIYWNCAFLRMGTSGLTAQALGARNLRECVDLLIRGMIVALGIAALLLVFQVPLGNFAVRVMQADENVLGMVREYFFARIWAAPATVSLYAIHGWFIGMQNSRFPMWVSIIQNFINIAFSLWFVFGMGMGIAGIAWGTVVSQYSGALISWYLWSRYYGRLAKYIDWRDAVRIRPMLRFFNVNKDIFLRTACNVFVYTFFTYASTEYGTTVLAANSILIQLFTFFSYMSDGFAYAAEAITGRLVGAGNFKDLKSAVKWMFLWSLAIAVFFVLVYIVGWRAILGIFTDLESVISAAGNYIWWVIMVPLVGFAPFLMDGILIGATKTRVLRDSMFISTVIFFGLYYSLKGTLGNDALWFSFVIFLISRGVNQYFMTGRLKGFIRE